MAPDKGIVVDFGGHRSERVATPSGSTTGTADAPVEWTAFMDSLLVQIRTVIASREQQEGMRGMAVAVADDLTVAVSAPTAEAISRAARAVLGKISEWSGQHNMIISPKSSALLVQAWSRNHQANPVDPWVTNDRHRQPLGPLRCGGVEIPVRKHHETIKILGVLWDGYMRFTQHFEECERKVHQSMYRIVALERSMPPWQSRKVYLATAVARARHHLHVLVCGAAHDTGALSCLEDRHEHCARRLAGAAANTNGAAALAEMGMLRLRTVAANVARKRAAELAPASRTGGATTAASDIMTRAHRLLAGASPPTPANEAMADEPPISPFEVPPAQAPMPTFDISGSAAGEARTDDEKRARNDAVLAATPRATIDVWTDGSYTPATNGERARAGAAFCIYDGADRDNAGAQPLATRGVGVATPGCSFTAEVEALFELLGWVIREAAAGDSVCVFTDTLSGMLGAMCGPLRQRVPRLRAVWRRALEVARKRVRVHFAFVYSHAGLPRSDVVDSAAKKAARLTPKREPWRSDALAAEMAADLERRLRDDCTRRAEGAVECFRVNHGQLRLTQWKLKDWRGVSPAQGRLMAQLRIGSAAALGGHLYGQDDPCPRCSATLTRGAGAPVEHVFACPDPEMIDARRGRDGAPLTARHLWTHPREALDYVLRFLPADRRPA